MNKHPKIEHSIATILTNCGLPMDRRTEVADELRDHLSQLVDAKCAEGMDEDQAIQTALAEFGSLAAIRRQLRKQQSVLDRRHVMADLRRYVWPLVAGCGIIALLVAIFAPAPASVSLRCLFGAIISVGVCGIMITYGVSAELLVYRLQRPRPRSEFHFQKSFCFWGAVVFGFFIFMASMSPLAIIVCGFFGQYAFLHSSPYVAPQLQAEAHWFLLRCLPTAMMDNPLRSFLLPLLTVLAGATAIALYERSRCVDEDEVADTFITE